MTKNGKAMLNYDRVAPAIKRISRRWYIVEGETGVGWGTSPYSIYTSVSQAVDSLKEARELMEDWMRQRNGLFHARIIRLEETRTVMVTRKPSHPVFKRKQAEAVKKRFWYTAQVRETGSGKMHNVFYACTRPKLDDECPGVGKPNKVISYRQELAP